MPTAADDRRFIIEQWQYLYGRMPTAEEVNRNVVLLQGGLPRSTWISRAEKVRTEDSVRRLYQQVLGRDPSPEMLRHWAAQLRTGGTTRRRLTEWLTGSTEAQLRQPEEGGPTEGQESARDLINGVLESYGLNGLSDWAWQQIQAGHSEIRVLQDLRETDQYKQRFAGMEARRAAGLNAISEAEYISYENNARQLMRAAGLPAEFYDRPEDFADLIGKDVSPAELNARINDGYLAAAQAPAEVRQQLRDLYGLGEGDLAAYFLDPDRALPLIQRQFAASQVSGAGVTTGYGALNVAEAERIASLGVTEDQARQGFGALVENEELFDALPGEQDGLIDRETQLGAVFGDDARARQQLERKAGARRSAASGSQSFQIGERGVSGLSRG